MSIYPTQCNVVAAAMKQSGMDYSAIARKANMSEEQVEKLCTGRQLPTSEQHGVISKVLGITNEATDNSAQVCQSRPLHGDLDTMGGECEHPGHHDIFEAAGLKNDAVARNTAANNAGKSLKSNPGLNPPGVFTWLKLKNVVKYTDDCSRFDFGFDDEKVVSDVLVSSTCVVSAPEEKPLFEDKDKECRCGSYKVDAKESIPVFRAYTPVTAPGAVGIISFLIKKQENGKMSNYIHSLKIDRKDDPGDRLGIMGYLQRAPSMIPWNLNCHETVIMIAGGVGITPLLQILQYSLPNPTNKTKFFLFFQNHAEKDIVMRKELDAFHDKYPDHFKVFYVFSGDWKRDTPADPNSMDDEFFKVYNTELKKCDPNSSAVVYVSAPPKMLKKIAGPRLGDQKNGFTDQGELKGLLKGLKYKPNQVHKF
ncbi:ferredoxin reductase-like protein [Gymnopus androsaceus JB14]|uniref:cytochrome-b5 reductase n=1 Tax=Gymnopus androsaceus JB14 TaxID=1447944 RepID=A0A6A4HAP0_9AGAR|nr:ferredoxin reductase-like protein [Gymnopus androsaceus JB14]